LVIFHPFLAKHRLTSGSGFLTVSFSGIRIAFGFGVAKKLQAVTLAPGARTPGAANLPPFLGGTSWTPPAPPRKSSRLRPRSHIAVQMDAGADRVQPVKIIRRVKD